MAKKIMKMEHMEAIVDHLSEGASSAPHEFPFITDNIPCSVYVPNEHKYPPQCIVPPLSSKLLIRVVSFSLNILLSIFMELD
jgi:hypothetical protein